MVAFVRELSVTGSFVDSFRELGLPETSIFTFSSKKLEAVRLFGSCDSSLCHSRPDFDEHLRHLRESKIESFAPAETSVGPMRRPTKVFS